MNARVQKLAELRTRLSARLPLAARVAILTTVSVGLTLAAVSIIVYFTARAEFNSSLDESLLRRATSAADEVTGSPINGIPQTALMAADIKIAFLRDGLLYSSPSAKAAREFVGPSEEAVANGDTERSMRTVDIGGTPFRVISVQSEPGTALVVAQSMESSSNALDRLRTVLLVVSFAGVVIAGLNGWVVAANGLRPVRRLTAAAERVARTEQLTPISVSGHDELARLTNAFNAMLLALGSSQQRQRQLVADAGHELRTPLTSLRTNIELLAQAETRGGLSDRTRLELMSDVRAQIGELTTLVGDLVELARDEEVEPIHQVADLAEVVQTCADRVRLRAPSIALEVHTQPWHVTGNPTLLERAVTNLLDNAAKWSPPLGTVRVDLTAGVLTVADDGPGISAEDRPHVFERFYRSREARMLPGSGLGLSIVSQAADRHGGSVAAGESDSGGALMTLTVPGSSEPRADADQIARARH